MAKGKKNVEIENQTDTETEIPENVSLEVVVNNLAQQMKEIQISIANLCKNLKSNANLENVTAALDTASGNDTSN